MAPGVATLESEITYRYDAGFQILKNEHIYVEPFRNGEALNNECLA